MRRSAATLKDPGHYFFEFQVKASAIGNNAISNQRSSSRVGTYLAQTVRTIVGSSDVALRHRGRFPCQRPKKPRRRITQRHRPGRRCLTRLTGVQAWKVLGALTAKMLGVSGTPLENYRTLPHSAAIFPGSGFVHAPFQSEIHDPS